MSKIGAWKIWQPKGLFWMIFSQIFEKEAQRYGNCVPFVVGNKCLGDEVWWTALEEDRINVCILSGARCCEVTKCRRKRECSEI